MNFALPEWFGFYMLIGLVFGIMVLASFESIKEFYIDDASLFGKIVIIALFLVLLLPILYTLVVGTLIFWGADLMKKGNNE